MFCRNVWTRKKKKKAGSVPVYLNVYDLTPMNCYGYWLGIGIYHSGLQVHGTEYGYGAHEQPSSGIFEVEPKKCPGFTFRKSILLGETEMTAKEVRVFMEKLAEEYKGNNYHIITRNCNHFCNQVSLKLTQKSIPSWVNRLARIGKTKTSSSLNESECFRRSKEVNGLFVFGMNCLGFLCNCVLPANLNELKVKRVGKDGKLVEGRKKKKKKKITRSRSGPLVSSSSPTNTKRDSTPSHSRSISTGSLPCSTSTCAVSKQKPQDQKTPSLRVKT